MGTKLNPSPHDAWDKALDDEQRFALLARDMTMPPLIRIWLAWQIGDWDLAKQAFVNGCVQATKLPYRPGKTEAHVLEARKTATEAELWLKQNTPLPGNARAFLWRLKIDEIDVEALAKQEGEADHD